MSNPAYVADAVTAASFPATSTAINLPIANTVPTGASIVLGICDNYPNARLVGVSDSRGNTWQLCQAFTNAPYDQTYIYVAPAIANPLTAGADHITVVLSSAGRLFGAFAEVVSNLPATFTVDASQSAYSGAGGSTSLTVTATSEYPGDWAFTFIGISASSPPKLTGPVGYTLRAGGLVPTGLNGYFAMADRFVPAAGPITANWSESSESIMVATLVTFRNTTTSYPPAPIVQVASSGLVPQSANSASVNLNRLPTVGNLLIAIYGGIDAGNQIGTGPAAYLSPPTGFSELAHPVNIDQTNNSNCVGVGIAYRVVQPSDGRSWTFVNNAAAYGTPWYGMGAIIYELSGMSSSIPHFAISKYGQGGSPGAAIGESIYNVPANSVAIAVLASLTTTNTTPSSYSSSSPASPGMQQDQLLISSSLSASLVSYRDITDSGTVTGNVTTSAAIPSLRQCVQVLVVASPVPIGGPQIIQSAQYGEDSTISPYVVTLPQVPSPGNMLVALFGGMNDSPNFVEPAAGFTQLTTVNSPYGPDGRTFNQAAVAYRFVLPGDSKTWTFPDYNVVGGQTNYSSGVFLVEVANVGPTTPTYSAATGSGAPFGEVRKLVAQTSLLLGVASMYDSQSGNGWSSGSAATVGWVQIGSVTGTLGDYGSLGIFAAWDLSGVVLSQMQNTATSPQWAAVVVELAGLVNTGSGFLLFFDA